MTKKKVFISYDYDNDKHYKNLLLAWDAHKLFDFSIYDHSVDISVKSINATYIKSVISKSIRDSSYFLVIIGKNTHRSSWVTWEIEKAVALRKKIVAVKIASGNYSPTAIYGVGAKWAMSFTYLAIKSAIDNA